MSENVAVEASPSGNFRIGKTLGRSVSLFFGNLLVYLPLACVPGIPSLFLPTVVVGLTPQAMQQFGLVYLAVFLIAYPFVQSTIIYAAIQQMRGQPPSLVRSIPVAFSRFLPVLGTLLCTWGLFTLILVLLLIPGSLLYARYFVNASPGVRIGLGFLGIAFLIVPTLWLALRYYVAMAVCAVERIGPLKSMKRSAELTGGHRWRLFGLGLLVAIIVVVLGMVIGGILGFVLSMTGHVAWLLTGGSVIRFIISGLSFGFGVVVVAVIYHDLRVAKDGIDTDRIAAVFD
jgi:hypothetical protein